MGRIFTRAYAPSTLGSFLRSFTFGHVRQLDAVASRFLIALAGLTGLLGQFRGPALIEEDAEYETGYALLDVDDTIIEVHGHAKQGAGLLRGAWAQRAAGHAGDRDERAGGRGPTAPQGFDRLTARREAAGLTR